MKSKFDCDETVCNEINPLQFKPNTSTSQKVECPPDRAKVGKAGWTLFHTTAAYYPEEPTEEDKKHYYDFFATIPFVYPCKHCATDFERYLKKSPPEVDNRETLCVWLCRMHNKVNQKLGKKVFPCRMKDLDRRWRKNLEECSGFINPEDIVN